ncbi:hypothetical protein MTO96_049444, partial [Rhipicephalus appendiculatus]
MADNTATKSPSKISGIFQKPRVEYFTPVKFPLDESQPDSPK